MDTARYNPTARGMAQPRPPKPCQIASPAPRTSSAMLMRRTGRLACRSTYDAPNTTVADVSSVCAIVSHAPQAIKPKIIAASREQAPRGRHEAKPRPRTGAVPRFHDEAAREHVEQAAANQARTTA